MSSEDDKSEKEVGHIDIKVFNQCQNNYLLKKRLILYIASVADMPTSEYLNVHAGIFESNQTNALQQDPTAHRFQF